MKNWAENEVKIACKKENPNWDGKSFDYGCACYQSALKAYKAMSEDNHSGASWSITGNILNRLIRGLPLTPIEDKDFVQDPQMPQDSEEYLKENNLKSEIQCPRMPSLFKEEYLDGKIEYKDVERAYCFNIDDPDTAYSCFLDSIIDELYPITMPYYPAINRYKIAVENSSHDKSLGDCDLIRAVYIIRPDGGKQTINRCYQEVITGYIKYENFNRIVPKTKIVEISYDEYKRLSKNQIESHYNPEVDELEIINNSKNNCECCG